MNRNSIKKGFTLIEILIVVIILGILAAIVIPQFTSATTEARQGNLKSQLQTLRSQIALYKLQHRDNAPAQADADFWRQLTTVTNESGVTNPAGNLLKDEANGYKYGPYFEARIENPLTKLSTVGAIAGEANMGWAYDSATGKIEATATTAATSIFEETK